MIYSMGWRGISRCPSNADLLIERIDPMTRFFLKLFSVALAALACLPLGSVANAEPIECNSQFPLIRRPRTSSPVGDPHG